MFTDSKQAHLALDNIIRWIDKKRGQGLVDQDYMDFDLLISALFRDALGIQEPMVAALLGGPMVASFIRAHGVDAKFEELLVRSIHTGFNVEREVRGLSKPQN